MKCAKSIFCAVFPGGLTYLHKACYNKTGTPARQQERPKPKEGELHNPVAPLYHEWRLIVNVKENMGQAIA